MASCPNCGFDLNQDGACPVCGYGRAAQGGTPTVKAPASGSSASRGERPRRRLLVTLGIVAFCVIAGAGVFAVARLSASGRAADLTGSLASASGAARHTPSSVSDSADPSQLHQPVGSAKGPEAAASGAASATASEEPGSASGSAASPSAARSAQVYRYPVGASPVSLRAAKPIDLYDPAVQPVYDITKRTAFPPITSEDAYVKWMTAHTDQQEKFIRWRWQRAEITVERHLVANKNVLMAFLLTPREWFVRSYNLSKTYDNTAIPIGYGQTISGPELVAHMTDELDLKPNESVLEIGTGSGYQSAVLSQLSNFVYTIEIVKPLAEETNQIYLEHTKEIPEYANIHRRLADGYYGWLKYAPFDRIIVTTGIDHIPPELLKQLKPGGIMLIPIGPPSGQVILKITKTVGKNGNIHLTREDIYHGFKREIFVPFTAAGGGTHNLGGSKP